MLPEFWLHDRELVASPKVAVLRLEESSPAGAIVDLRVALHDFLRLNHAVRHLIVDIREHDARCAGTLPAMWGLADVASDHGCRIVFIAHSVRIRDGLTVVRSDEEALRRLE